jgi:hypothetical protein
MRTRLRANLRSESGAVSLGTIFGLAIAAVVVYVLLGAAKADTAHFGVVPLPGTDSLTFTKGEAQVFYSTASGTGTSFVLPTDLTFQVTDSAGTALESEKREGSFEDTDSGETELVGAVQIPDDGTYTVTTSGVPDQAAAEPELTFGQSPFGAIKDRANNVIDELKGPAGIALLVILVLLYAYTKAQAAARHTGRDEPDYS